MTVTPGGRWLKQPFAAREAQRTDSGSVFLANEPLQSLAARRTAPGAATTDDNADRCPVLRPDVAGDKSEKAIADQVRTTGTPPGYAYFLPDPYPREPPNKEEVSFDGCEKKTGVMIESKGDDLAWAIDAQGNWQPFYRGRKIMEDQMDRQARSAAAEGRQVI